mmetsp:Transcript_40580/g.126323  ORF Transcript_40580/g.126323 Transcript_40580/m.126323 type:complete len:297 (-) Transcript_40580:103-993(-)
MDLSRSTNSMVGPLGMQIAELQNAMRAQQAQQASASSSVARLDGQQRQMDAVLKQLMDDFGFEKGNKGPNLADDVKRLREASEEQASRLGSLDQTASSQEEQLRRAEERATALEQGQAKLFRRTDAMQQQIGEELERQASKEAPPSKPSTPVPPSEPPRGLLRFQMAAKRVSLMATNKQIKERLDQHDRDLQQEGSRLKATGQELGTTVSRVAALEGKMAAAQEEVSKLKSGLQETQECWNGLRTGLRETHRSIAVENKMLPGHSPSTRPSTTSTLPAIGKASLTAHSTGSCWTAR